jgi:L-iditol 2-dehydrogenase
MMANGELDVGSLISVVAPLSEGAEWFRRLYEGQSGLIKVVLEP